MIGEYVICPDGEQGKIIAVDGNKVKVGRKWYIYADCLVVNEV